MLGSVLVKTIIAIIVAGMILSMAPPAAAAPVETSGTVSIKYEVDTAADTPTESGMMYTFTLRGEKKIGKGLSIYGRFGAQYASNPVVGDYDLSFYGQDVKAVAAVDQFGLIYKSNKLVYKLGRQDIAVGVTELLYNRPETNIGNNAFVDGISVNGSIGAVDVTAIVARENNIWLPNNSFYALRTGYNLSKNTNLGLTLAQYQYYNAETSHHWAVDGTVVFGKNSLTAEYTQSGQGEENKAYALTWNYKFNDKTTLYVINFRVEANGDMGKQSEYDNNNRGFYYGITHAFTDKLLLEVVYKDQALLTDNSKNTKVEVTLTNSF